MKRLNLAILVVFSLAIVLTSIQSVSAKGFSDAKSHKDPGVINKERIIYWLTKRGELSFNASETEKQQALSRYLKHTKNGGYKLPAKLAKLDQRLQLKLKALKAFRNSKSKLTTQKSAKANAQAVDKTVNILVVMIDFPDLPYDNNRLKFADTGMFYNDYNVAHYNDLVFSTSGYAGPSGQNLISGYQYYQSESGNTLFLQGTAIDWVTADKNSDAYGGNDPDDDDGDIDVASLIKEAVSKAVAGGGINLADFDVEDQFDLDNDGNVNEPDGIIDHVMVFHSSIGEEAGGGVLGDDAIWSHRSFVDTSTTGYTIPGTNFKVLGYTIEPLDSAAGVVVHEFGHDLGVPDEYNTNSNTVDSPVEFWSLMASGSWAGTISGTQPVGLSPYAKNFFQQRFDGDWVDISSYTLEDLITAPQLVTLTEAVNHNATTNLLKIEIPQPLISFFPPFTGSYQYHSDDGDNMTNDLSFSLTVPDTANVQLQMKAHWNIELDFDYSRVLVNGTAIAGNRTSTNNPRHSGITDYITGVSANVSGSTGAEGWLDLSYDMSAYQDQTVTITIEYLTDPFVGGYGFVVDDIELIADGNQVYFDGAETDTAVTLNGFQRITGTREGKDQNYWVQMRSYNGVDGGLNTRSYKRGMLVWLDDKNYSNNHVDEHPGFGFTGVIDAGQTFQNGASGGVQIRDAAFSFYDSAESSTFDDSEDYSTPQQPSSGKELFSHGLNISLQSQTTNSSSASILLSVNSVVWTANYVASKTFRTVTFTNASSGTSTATASWDFGDGSALSSEWSPTHTYQSSGDYTVTLTITTVSDGSISVSTQNISIAEQLSASFQAAENMGVVSFDASLSGGEGGYTYSWNFGDGSTAGSGQQVTHNYSSSGMFTVVLTATSTDNQTVTSSQIVEVYILPAAGFNVTTSNLSATFINISTGGDGNLVYAWDFGDGTTSNQNSPSHTYTAAGTFTVELVITDGRNNTSTSSSTVTVTAAPVTPPPSSGGGGGAPSWLLLSLILLGYKTKK